MEESIRLVSSGEDIKIWNSSSMTVVDQFNPHASAHPVSRVCWSSNNHFLVSACASGDKIVVSSCKSSPVPVLDLAEGKRQTCVNLNSTSQFIVSGGLDNTVNIWDLKSKKLHRSLKDHKDVVTCVSFNGNDSYIASGSTSGEIILHSITTNLSSTPFGHGSTQPIQDLKYSYVKKSLMGSVSDSGTVVLWDANTQKPQHTFEGAHKAPACGLCFSPANELLFVTVGLDKRIICYDTSSKKVLRGMVAESPLTAIDFMPDGAVLAVGSSRGKIYLYDLRMLTSPVKTVSAHKTSVQCLKFQHSPSQTKSSSKTSASKSSTTLSASTYKRATVQSSTREALQKPAAPAAQHTSGTPASGERGDGRQDNSAEMPRSTSLDVFPSKETDSLKSINRFPSLEKFDTVGRNSLSDVLSPVRDDYTTQKGSGDCSKGDGLDFLSQFTSGLPARRAPLGTSEVQTSPFIMFGNSPQPVREEEEEEPKPGRAQLGLQDTELSKISSSSTIEPVSMNTPGMLASFKSPDMRGKDVQTKLQYESPVNGALPSVPILSPSPGVSAAGVASSLSERIADTIGSDSSSAPLTSIQIHFIRNMIQETLEDFRESCHRDIVNLQVEMIRQFYIQLNEIHSLIERYSVTDVLVAEIEKLKEENKKLRTNF
ncbi:protein NEDD1-like isoform X1 [Polyodon spathula]|uniref:protein NEDD1-like isoform X1 n=1 Tax=Polyodon spathula TaxID=7913 RepID=UPI001B7DD59C|nr:protein NEDD1-like isoform X1 [Polyodon spathula]XP_041110012.1 protein NEDD1-like isoform X1 [Polyodon spathula]